MKFTSFMKELVVVYRFESEVVLHVQTIKIKLTMARLYSFKQQKRIKLQWPHPGEESPISPEAHSRYRRVLGRLAWLAQTRMDLLHYTSLLASGQAEPRPGHEKALRQVLRFVATDSHVGQHFPTEDRQTHLLMVSQVIVYTDASFAPLRVLQRRSISGAVLMYQAVTIKCFSRMQAAVSLSACEAELHAIQGGVQEAIGLARTLAFVLRSLNIRQDLASLADLEEGECPLNIQLRTDSLSGKQLLESYDLQRRSRHIEIRLCWLRRLLNSSILELSFCRGEMNLSDMFTKCVSQALFQSFRTVIGFLLNDLRLSLIISGSEKQKALDDDEESESLRDLEGKPLGRTSKLTQRVFQVFQLRESFQRGRRCMLCDDVIEDDLLVEGEGEVLNSVSPSAAVVGSAASSLSGVILTVGVMASSSDKDEDRRSMREAREEAMAKEGVPDAKESKKKRRRREKKKGKTPGEESKVNKSKEDEMEEVEVEGEEPAQSSKPPVRPPPVVPPKVKKDHLKQKVDKEKVDKGKVDKGKKGKGKGEKGKGKDKGKGKGKKGKGKGEVASPSKPKSRPQEPPTPPPGHVAVLGSTSRYVMAGMGGSPAKPICLGQVLPKVRQVACVATSAVDVVTSQGFALRSLFGLALQSQASDLRRRKKSRHLRQKNIKKKRMWLFISKRGVKSGENCVNVRKKLRRLWRRLIGR